MDKLKKLAVNIALVGGLGIFIAINTVPIVINNNIRKSKHYKQALGLLSSHPEAVKYLGEQITGHHINVINKKNYGSDDIKMWLRVPVSGPMGRGKLFYDFVMDDYNKDSFQLSHVELVVDKFKDYKLVIKSE